MKEMTFLLAEDGSALQTRIDVAIMNGKAHVFASTASFTLLWTLLTSSERQLRSIPLPPLYTLTLLYHLWMGLGQSVKGCRYTYISVYTTFPQCMVDSSRIIYKYLNALRAVHNIEC
jgi:hypothetical protein